MIAALLSATALIAYFFGSMSTPILNSNLFFHTNLLKYSRDNVGLTRFEKRFGKKGFVILFLTEALKVIIPMLIGGWLLRIADYKDVGRAFALFCVVLGTNFPIMYRFKGEHSLIAVGVGLFFVSREIGFLTAAAFVVCYLLTHYISLSAILATMAMCLLTLMTVDEKIVQNILFFTALLIIIEYRKNIINLLKGKEQKFRFRRDLTYMFDEDY